MTGSKPEGWVEPVPDGLLRPPSFFGAAPRALALSMYIAVGGLEFLVIVLGGGLVEFIAPIVASAFVHLALAALSYAQPYWFDQLVEWLLSPQSRVDP